MALIFFAALSLLSSIIIFLIGILVLHINSRNRENRVFVLLCLLLSYWAFAEFQYRIAENQSRARFWLAVSSFWPLAAALLMHFVVILTRRSRRWRRRICWAVYPPLTAIALLQLGSDYVIGDPILKPWGWTYQFPTDLLSISCFAFVGLIGLAAVLLCGRYYLGLQDPRQKRQVRLVLIGVGLPVVVGSLAQISLPLLGLQLPELTNTTAALAGGAIIGFAVWRYQLFTVTPTSAADKIVATMPDGLLLLDTRHRITTANQAALDMLGYQYQELEGRDAGTIFLQENEAARLNHLSANEPLKSYETVLATKAGQRLPATISRSPIVDSQSQPQGSVMVFQDISEIKRSEELLLEREEQFRSVVQSATDAIVTINQRGNVIFWNETAERLFGYAANEIIGQPIILAVPLLSRSSYHLGLGHGEPFPPGQPQEATGIRRGGGRFPLEFSLSRWRVKNEVYFTAIIRDISERKQVGERLRQQSSELMMRNAELSALSEIAAAINQTIDLTTLLDQVLQTIFRLQILGGSAAELRKGGIFIVKDSHLELAAHLGHAAEFLQQHRSVAVGQCLCGLAAQSGQVITSKNSVLDQRHTINDPELETHGHVIIPLCSGENTIGVLYLYLPAGAVMEQRKIELLKAIGSQLAIAIVNSKLFEETKMLALHDPLTGLANRRLMYIELERGIAQTKRGKQLAVIMIDLDKFKDFNDNFGHTAGDRLLVELARLIGEQVRETDLVVRFGGEEFFVILPDTDIAAAGAVAERIRLKTENMEFKVSTTAPQAHITISLGVTAYQRAMASSDALISIADACLYRAKARGRNRVELCPEQPAGGAPGNEGEGLANEWTG